MKEEKPKIYKLKKTGEELQGYLMFKRRGSRIEAKKGKGARYKRCHDGIIPKNFDI